MTEENELSLESPNRVKRLNAHTLSELFLESERDQPTGVGKIVSADDVFYQFCQDRWCPKTPKAILKMVYDLAKRHGFQGNIRVLDEAIRIMELETVLNYCGPAPFCRKTLQPIHAKHLAFANSFVDVDTFDARSLSGVIPSTPEIFCPNAHPASLLANGSRQTAELDQCLDAILGDQQSKDAFQIFCGSLLKEGLMQQYPLYIFGQPRSGKGILTSIAKIVAGKGRHTSFAYDEISGRFGLQEWKTAWLAYDPDCRMDLSKNFAAVQRILKISGEDEVNVDSKFKESKTMRLSARILIASNYPPSYIALDDALRERFIILETKGTISQSLRDPKLKEKLLLESNGILFWAIEGYRKALQYGHIPQPARSAIDRLACLSVDPPMFSFVRDYLDVSQSGRCQIRDVKTALAERFKSLNLDSLCRRLLDELKRMGIDVTKIRPRGEGSRPECYVGITLRSASSQSSNGLQFTDVAPKSIGFVPDDASQEPQHEDDFEAVSVDIIQDEVFGNEDDHSTCGISAAPIPIESDTIDELPDAYELINQSHRSGQLRSGKVESSLEQLMREFPSLAGNAEILDALRSKS